MTDVFILKVEISLDELVAQGPHRQPRRVHLPPHDLAVLRRHDRRVQKVALASEQLKLRARIGSRGGLVEHAEVAKFQSLIRTDDQHLGRIDAERLHFRQPLRSEEHTSELQSLMRISYAVFCLKKKKQT